MQNKNLHSTTLDLDVGENIKQREQGSELTARPISEWHEGIGEVLWWRFPVDEPPYVGTPLDLGQTVEVTVRRLVHGGVVCNTQCYQVGGWPGYHTHFTEITIPHTPDLRE